MPTVAGGGVWGGVCEERRRPRLSHALMAAHDVQLRTIQKLTTGLSVAMQRSGKFGRRSSGRSKFARAADVVAMRTFVDFLDPRRVGTAAFGAVETNCLDEMRLLHKLRADFDKPNTHDGGVPAGIAAGNGHTAMVQLLYDLGAEANRARAGEGKRPIHSAAQNGHEKTALLLIALRAAVNAQDNEGRSPCWYAANGGQ